MKRPGSKKVPAAFGVLIAAAAVATSILPRHTTVSSVKAIHTVRQRSTPAPTPTLDDAATPSPSSPAKATIAVGNRIVVPILMYHYIRINPVPADKVGFGLSVPPASFALQMAYLHYHGVHTVTLAQVTAAVDGGPALPSRPVVLTFDDGHDDFATQAVPILQRYGFVGTDFVVPGFLGHTSYMTRAQVQMADAAGMVIAAHTVDHVALAHVSQAVAKAEIDGSKQMLEQLLGHPVLDFAYPYGSYDAAVADLVKQAGFRDACTTVNGDVQYAASPYTFSRFKVGGGESLVTFAHQALLPAPPVNWQPPADTPAPQTPVPITPSPAPVTPSPNSPPSPSPS